MADSVYSIQKYDISQIEEQFKDRVGKTDSIYTVVLFNCGTEELLEFTKSKSQIVQKIKDSHRRGRAKKAYYNLKEFGESFAEEMNHNCLILMDVEKDLFEVFELPKRVVKLLSEYECDQIWLKCTDHVDLNELRDYLESDEYFNLFRVKNNTVRHIRLGRTKRVMVDSKESRSLILADYIHDRLDATTKYLAYGVSSKLAPLKSADIRQRAYDVLSYDINDNDAIDYIQRMEQSDILDQMDDDYSLINNQKTMDRVIFKKEFKPNKMGILQKMYIDRRMVEKFMQNCEKGNVDVSWEVIVIEHTIKDFEEGRELRLMNEFGGVMGITYY